jgi:hypothetical protein
MVGTAVAAVPSSTTKIRVLDLALGATGHSRRRGIRLLADFLKEKPGAYRSQAVH